MGSHWCKLVNWVLLPPFLSLLHKQPHEWFLTIRSLECFVDIGGYFFRREILEWIKKNELTLVVNKINGVCVIHKLGRLGITRLWFLIKHRIGIRNLLYLFLISRQPNKILIKITILPAPSSIAASDKLIGIVLKLDRNQKILKGIDSPIWGSIRDQ